MTEPVLQMVGLAVDDKPNKAAEIFSDEMTDRAADYVQAAKDVISNGMMGQELPEPDVEVEFERGSVTFLSAWNESFSRRNTPQAFPPLPTIIDGEQLVKSSPIIRNCVPSHTFVYGSYYTPENKDFTCVLLRQIANLVEN